MRTAKRGSEGKKKTRLKGTLSSPVNHRASPSDRRLGPRNLPIPCPYQTSIPSLRPRIPDPPYTPRHHTPDPATLRSPLCFPFRPIPEVITRIPSTGFYAVNLVDGKQANKRRTCSATAPSTRYARLCATDVRNARISYLEVRSATFSTRVGAMCNLPCRAMPRILRRRWRRDGMFLSSF